VVQAPLEKKKASKNGRKKDEKKRRKEDEEERTKVENVGYPVVSTTFVDRGALTNSRRL
jgi:hypothetical protein